MRRSDLAIASLSRHGSCCCLADYSSIKDKLESLAPRPELVGDVASMLDIALRGNKNKKPLD